MLRKFAEGKIKQNILLPGPNIQGTITKLELESNTCGSLKGRDCYDYEGKNYVNSGLKDYDVENEEHKELSKTTLPSSSMSCVDSITYAGSMADLKDLNLDEIRLFENYKFKDPADISNNLEIAKFKEQIIQTINANCTVLVSGVTGCGKSTQVPQYILDDCMSRKKYCNIVVTQPRRIAAISISKQVNKERRWKNGLLVGYQVGRKRDFDPNTTKVLYCTTGVLLQKLIKAKSLSEFTHIILDEVHERSLEMDFLLLIIKRLLKTNSQSTRVILMSATADAFKLCDYFNEYYGPPHNKYVAAPSINIKQKLNYSIYIHYLDDLYAFIPSSRKIELNNPKIEEAGYETAIQLVEAFDEMEVDSINKNSSVLIFLPGIFEIEELHRLMMDCMVSRNHKWTLLPLHSSIMSEEQDRVFETPILNHRKIILTTNIAESSITVPDVSYVIDFCLMKQLKNDMKSNYSMLIMTWASKSNCDQRSGRVGRVADGRVYRLVSKNKFSEHFAKQEQPEISRCSLSRIVLMSKILDMGTPKQLLAGAMDPPSLQNIVLTILTLKQVGALLPTVNGVITSLDGDITFLGKVMAQLPLEPPMSKLIYFGHIFNILNEAIIMACGLSIKSVFSQPFNKRLEAYTQKLTWANHSYSDPIAYIGPYQSWLSSKPEFDRNRFKEKLWAKQNYIQLSAMRELYDLVNDVTMRLKTNFGIIGNSGKMYWNRPEEKALACKIILAGAFYPNYFVRGTTNAYMDEHDVLKLLDGHDPNKTVYFTGFPNDQPKELYKEAIENMFPHNLVGKPTAYFNTSNKIYVEFPMSKINNSSHDERKHQLIPGNICFGVYVALKMRQLKFEFKIPLLKPADAKKKVEIMSQQMAAIKIAHQENVLSVKKCVLEEIKSNKVIDITISYFESVGYFWAQLFDNHNKQKLIDLWRVVNEQINLTRIDSTNLKMGEIYIVDIKEEKYRAKLLHIISESQKKYKFLLIDFGEAIELLIENVFDVLNEDKKKVFNTPALAFQCKIAKIRPAVQGKLENKWCHAANAVFSKCEYGLKLCGTVYSIVNDIMSFDDLTYVTEENIISIPENLIQRKLATRSEELFASKMDHEKRSMTIGDFGSTVCHNNSLCLNLKSPTEVDSYYTIYNFKGPFNPLEISVQGLNCTNITKDIKIESQSINSVLLDTNPNDYHERLFVAGNVFMNENERLTLWDTTMMPNIPGMPAIICLMFSPCVEIRYNNSYTKMIGAICGLGYDPDTLKSLFKENDIEITFDTIIDHKILNQINVIRMLLNKCVNPEDEGPGDIFQLQHSLQMSLMEIFSLPIKFKAPENYLRKYMWGTVPKSRLQTPFHKNSPINHPMAGSDVYKLLWGVILSSKMSEAECKDLFYKLSKIKRFEEGISFNQLSSEMCSEELSCPLCHLTFSNSTSVKMHFDNYQHVERYKQAKEELQIFYKGPFSNIQNL